jgi:methionyl-tRNA formyltransferase
MDAVVSTALADECETFVQAENPHGCGFSAKVPSDSIVSIAVPGLVAGTAKQGILIQTRDGVYAVSRLQRKAKKALDWKTFLNGARDFIGSRLG